MEADAVTDACQRALAGDAEAAELALEECLKALEALPEEDELKGRQLGALSEALTVSFELSPALAAAGHMGLAFRASAIVAWLARRARALALCPGVHGR